MSRIPNNVSRQISTGSQSLFQFDSQISYNQVVGGKPDPRLNNPKHPNFIKNSNDTSGTMPMGSVPTSQQKAEQRLETDGSNSNGVSATEKFSYDIDNAPTPQR